MYYEGRWEREYFEKQPKFDGPSLWQLCLSMLVAATLVSITSLAFWVLTAIVVQNVDVYLSYLGSLLGIY